MVPVALVVAGTQMATGHRTMDTHLYFEGELIDAATNKPVVKVVRQGEGKDLSNENTPMAFETLKEVIDDMATDATMFDVGKK
ncbi:lipoprotein [Citrobacter koseri]|uniref:Lipoprotein n=1 Tax=Citrobacter koseri TaxID=545 RepID=A0A447UFF7_CITKO|nr:lipoprotein [Citrobacter koseri]